MNVCYRRWGDGVAASVRGGASWAMWTRAASGRADLRARDGDPHHEPIARTARHRPAGGGAALDAGARTGFVALQAHRCVRWRQGSHRRDKIQWRMAKVDEAACGNHEEYKARLRAVAAEAAGASAGAWMPPRTELLELPSNYGFCFAMRTALGRVDTPLVCVVQHDRTFMRSVDVESIVRSMLEYGGHVGYVLMHTKSTGKYVACQSSRLREKGMRAEDCDIEKLALPLPGEGGRLLPCLTWYDSTHLCLTSYYSDLVFSPAEGVVKKGGFIEGETGQLQFPEFCARGPAPALGRWRTYLYDDGSEAPMVGHLDGKRFKSVETLKQLYGDRATGRRAPDAPDLPATGVGSDSGEG